jgi:hypothetical protein
MGIYRTESLIIAALDTTLALFKGIRDLRWILKNKSAILKKAFTKKQKHNEQRASINGRPA